MRKADAIQKAQRCYEPQDFMDGYEAGKAAGKWLAKRELKRWINQYRSQHGEFPQFDLLNHLRKRKKRS